MKEYEKFVMTHDWNFSTFINEWQKTLDVIMQWKDYSIKLMDVAIVSRTDIHSCVADNALGRAKKYIEVSGRPGPAQFHSPLYSRSRDIYNLTWSVESVPKLDEIRILYRKLMVSCHTAHKERLP